MQLGLEMVYTDPITQSPVPWAKAEQALLQRITRAPFKVVDCETTGLNPASKQQNFSGKQLRRGVRPDLRLRVVSVLYPLVGTPRGVDIQSFDLDMLDDDERAAVCSAALSRVVIGHNAGFDGFWLRQHSKTRPYALLDTMLIARVLAPDHPLVLAKMADSDKEDSTLRAEAEMVFKSGASGWSLAHLCLGRLRKVVAKDRQGPKNWCEPFLDQQAYNYATGDVQLTYELLLDLVQAYGSDDVLKRYADARVKHEGIRIVEPQVLDVVEMREHGMSWSQEEAEAYVLLLWDEVKAAAKELVRIEPALAPFETHLGDAERGITAPLKLALGEAFSSRGLVLEVTDAKGEFKIGEKDLRRARAQVTQEAAELFTAWVRLNRAKKAGNMAREVSRFAAAGDGGRLHPNTGHGPATGRLSSSEPNCQQFPRDQRFRNCVRAGKGKKMVGVDYGALDMRVGAALAIRAQARIREVYEGKRQCDAAVHRIITLVYEGGISAEQAREVEADADKAFADWKLQRDSVLESGDPDARKSYWDRYRKLSRASLLAGFQRCLAEVLERARADGEPYWSALRDAFAIPGMDIHTWTALDMRGKNPRAIFTGKSNDEVVKELKAWKKELGDFRQTGKVGNLSLLYAMKSLGLMDAAAKNYNIHWTLEESDAIRVGWLKSYVEVDLWHKWTELNPHSTVHVPDPDRGMKRTRKDVYASWTLGNRLIYAFGLNAGLSYEDQSTGADIMGRVMESLRRDHPDIFAGVVNQVHDELVLELDEDVAEAQTDIVHRVMVECAEHFTMPFGVKVECSPAIGDVWLKD